jgi:peptidoglycan LD-endopeptidase CwlK
MPQFSKSSAEQLATCDERLQRIANEAIKIVDFVITEGHRNEEKQNVAYAKGLSKVKWPDGNHNQSPSKAFDFAPYPIDWSEKAVALARFTFVCGVMWKIANDLGIKLRFGWDWNRNLDSRDEKFLDWPHVELDEK